MNTLLPYQQEGVKRILDMGGSALLADAPGLGKTVQAIEVCNQLNNMKRIMIACPATVKINWMREWLKWSKSGLSVGIAYSTKIPNKDVVIINYDIIEANSEELTEIDFDMVICDEAHMLKNPGAKRTQRMMGLKCRGIKARHKLLLTGTPLLSRPIELYPLLWWLNPKGWGTYEEFGNRYCYSEQRIIVTHRGSNVNNIKLLGNRKQYDKKYWEAKIIPLLQKPYPVTRVIGEFQGAINLDELSNKLTSCTIRRRKEDVLKELPDKIRQVVEIDPDEHALALLCAEHKMWKDLRKSAALYGRATDWKSLATGFKGRSTLERTRRELSLAKVSAVMEFIKAAIETSGKVVVFGYHKEAIGKIQERLTKLGIKSAKITGDVPQYSRQAEVDAFQTKEDVMVFLGQYQAAGVGITLTASNRVIFIEPDWTPAIMEQAEDRTHRIGQTKGVYCQYLVYADSIECEVVKAAVKKQDVIDQTLATVEGKGRQGGDVERKEVLEWI